MQDHRFYKENNENQQKTLLLNRKQLKHIQNQ